MTRIKRRLYIKKDKIMPFATTWRDVRLSY